MTTELQQRIATILDPTVRTTEPAAGDIGHNRMFLQPGSIDPENRTARFVCSTGDVDRYGEIVEPQAFAKWLPVFMRNPVLLAGHTHIGPAGEPTTIGHWIDLQVTEDGLVGTAQFLADDPSGLADAYWHRYRNGAQKAVSVGFIVHGFEMRQLEQEGQRQLTRVFTEVELVEISAVAIPANRESLVRAAAANDPNNASSNTPTGEAAIAAVVERVLREQLDASPGSHLCGLIMDVVQAHGSDGFGFDYDRVPDHGSTPDRDADPEGDDNPLKHELREALAVAEDTE